MPWDGGLLVPTLFVRNQVDCRTDGGFNPDPNVLATVSGRQASEGARLSVTSLDAGRYLLGVQGFPGVDERLGPFSTTGPFVFDARRLPLPSVAPANSSCSTVVNLAIDGGMAELRGRTNLSADSFTHTCRSAAAPDVFYSFTTPAVPVTDAGFTALVWAVSENLNEFMPAVSVTQSCGVASSTLDCGGGGSRGLARVEGLPPNTTFSVAVSGTSPGQQGAFSLLVEVGAGPANEDCATATPVALNTPVSGSLVGSRNHYSRDAGYSGDCSYQAWEGGDVAYRFVPPVSGRYVASVNSRPGGSMSVNVFEGPCAVSSVCRDVYAYSSVNMPRTTFVGVAGVPVHIIVETLGAESRFSLEVRQQ